MTDCVFGSACALASGASSKTAYAMRRNRCLFMTNIRYGSGRRRQDRDAERALQVVVVAGVEHEVAHAIEAVESSRLQRDGAGLHRIGIHLIAGIERRQSLR